MNSDLSLDTQTSLLLTAPLIAGQVKTEADVLTSGEFKRLVRLLGENRRQPGDLLGPDAADVLEKTRHLIEPDQIQRLLERGFLLSQALEYWHARAIWVVGRTDDAYPSRLNTRLADDAPPILYGCGDVSLLDNGGLAVVGSRHVDDALVSYTENIGRLAASAQRTLISGGARGIDRAAMRGALEAGGSVSGVLADSLERVALTREHREVLMDGRLVLISPYDPGAGFNVGHAMQRNKLIYALSDATLVVSSDLDKGGTWNGAVEQLDKLHFVPVYVRTNGEPSKGLEALQRKGALPWPDPNTPESLDEALTVEIASRSAGPEQGELFPDTSKEP